MGSPNMFTTPLQEPAVMQHFPKVDLHRHLESMLTHTAKDPELQSTNSAAFALQRLPLKKSASFVPDTQYHFSSMRSMHTAVYEAVRRCKQDSLFYLELGFFPERFVVRGNSNRKKLCKTIVEAAEQAAHDMALPIRFLISFDSRAQDQFEMIHRYRQIATLKPKSITGIALVGNESPAPLEKFSEFFGYVHTMGNHKASIYISEQAKAQQIWFAIDNLHAARISSGLSAYRDKTLQRVLAARNIPLEQSIGTDHQAGIARKGKAHPFGTLYRKGVPVVVVSGSSPTQKSLLSEDYLQICNYFSFNIDDFVACNILALKTAFLDERSKADLIRQYTLHVDEFRKNYL